MLKFQLIKENVSNKRHRNRYSGNWNKSSVSKRASSAYSPDPSEMYSPHMSLLAGIHLGKRVVGDRKINKQATLARDHVKKGMSSRSLFDHTEEPQIARRHLSKWVNNPHKSDTHVFGAQTTHRSNTSCKAEINIYTSSQR